MRHYGLDPNSLADQSRVIFWDDSTTNISSAQSLGEVNAIHVPRNQTAGEDGGCGLQGFQFSSGNQVIFFLLFPSAPESYN